MPLATQRTTPTPRHCPPITTQMLGTNSLPVNLNYMACPSESGTDTFMQRFI